MKVCFRVDASEKIGSGHVMRCLTLARDLKKTGAKNYFITRNHRGNKNKEIKGNADELFSFGINDVEKNVFETQYEENLTVSWQQDAEDTINVLKQIKPDCLIVDHYSLDAKWHERIRNHVKNIIVLDDLANRTLYCDILIDQTYGRKKSEYDPHVPSHCRLLLGSSYALLRREFLDARIEAIKSRKNKSEIKHILISMGAGINLNLINDILDTLEMLSVNRIYKISVVIGQNLKAEKKEQLSRKRVGLEISLLNNVSNMAELMLYADISIGAGGTTSWERCCLGLPAIVISTAENQITVCENLHKKSSVYYLGHIDSINKNFLYEKFQSLFFNKTLLKKLKNNSFLVTDGSGSIRVAREISNRLTRIKDAVTLRPIVKDDKKLLYSWQTESETRKYAHNKSIPTFEEHSTWFDRKLEDPMSYTEVILCNDEPAGVLRLDPVKEDKYLVSINIATKQQNRGIAKKALEFLFDMHKKKTLRAEINVGNIASQKLFTSVGFTKINEGLFEKILN